MGIEYERLPWCDECEVFAVPTDEGVCGECGSEVVFRDAEELRQQRRQERSGDGGCESEEELTRRTPDGPPEDGKLMKSPITGNTYRVTEWEQVGPHRFLAQEKELVEEADDGA